MASKRNPGEYDCFANAAPDEPMFVLLGRDPAAPALVELWASVRENLDGASAQTRDARACARAMRAWCRGLGPVKAARLVTAESALGDVLGAMMRRAVGRWLDDNAAYVSPDRSGGGSDDPESPR